MHAKKNHQNYNYAEVQDKLLVGNLLKYFVDLWHLFQK